MDVLLVDVLMVVESQKNKIYIFKNLFIKNIGFKKINVKWVFTIEDKFIYLFLNILVQTLIF
jgi:hypothetical protein